MTPLIWIVPAVLLGVAVLPLPYGYYTFLRIIICASAIFLGCKQFAIKEEINAWTVIFGVCAILFNPVIPIHLTRDTWFYINIAGAVLFVAHYVYWRQYSKKVLAEN